MTDATHLRTYGPTDVPEFPDHTLDGWCWCQPRVERVTDLIGEEHSIFIHRVLMDMPDT